MSSSLPASARSSSVSSLQERMLDENERVEDIPSRSEEPRSYGALGARVTGILEAAERAAEEIKAEARTQAAQLERQAHGDAENLKQTLTEETRRAREEADEFARDMRLAVEAYASQHRRQAEEEGRTIVADAERQAAEMRAAAENAIQQAEAEVRRRNDALRAEVRMLEQRKHDAVERLREVAALVDDVLPEGRGRDHQLADDLEPERRRAPTSGG